MLKAYEDEEFLNSDPCRGIRLELEYLKPELVLQEQRVESTIVIFGSARILPPADAARALADARAAESRQPGSYAAHLAVAQAQQAVENSRYYTVAREFAALVTRECQTQNLKDGRRFVVMTGGGPGIMAASNRGAADMGGVSASLNITLPHEERSNGYATPELNFQFHYFCMRKMHFMKRAGGLACFPGGFGTLDELFEALTLVQTGTMRRIPILLYGQEFWENLINWSLLVRRGLISPEDLKLFTYCETAEDGWNALQEFYKNRQSL